jgi:DNA-binding response OmpR family regulator
MGLAREERNVLRSSVVAEVDHEFDVRRVLVVDDDRPMLHTHGRVLEAHGFLPTLMGCPNAALEDAKEQMPAAIMIDLLMSGMNGLEFVTRLRCHYGRACPPVILVSANHQQLSPMEQLMFDAIFPKPYSVDKVVYWVRRLAQEHADRRQAPSDILPKHGAPAADDDENEG